MGKRNSAVGEPSENNSHKKFFLVTLEIRMAYFVFVSLVVSILDCHSGDRVSIPRQKKLFDELR